MPTNAREGSGNKGGGGPWVPPEHDEPAHGTTLLIPTLTASASNSPPLVAPFVTPPTFYDGLRLNAKFINRLVNNNNWLWGVGVRTHDTQTGFIVDGAGYSSTFSPWRGYFTYAGVSKFLHGFWRTGASVTLKLYVTDDTAGEKKVFDSTTMPTAGTALSFASIVGGGSTAFTTGVVYTVRAEIVDGAAAYVLGMDFLAVVTANAVSWPTLVTLASGATPSAADLNTIGTAQNYLRALASTPTGSSVKVIATVGYAGGWLYTGGFFMNGRDSTHVQNRINIRYKFSTTTNPILTVCAIGSTTALDTYNLSQDGVQHNDSYALTVASYAPDTFYAIRVSGSNIPISDYVERVTVGGVLALSNAPVKAAHLGAVNGPGGLQNIGGSGATMNLSEIRTLLHGTAELQTGAGADTGFQFVAPIQDGSTTTSYVGGGRSTLGPGSHRPHVWRILRYQTLAGTSGTLTVGGVGVSLPDTGGAVQTYDLQNVSTLGYGMDYTLTNVIFGFEES